MATPNPDRYVNNIIDCVDFNSDAFNQIITFINNINE